MHAVSMSLYGSHARYLVGAIRNAQRAQFFYPGWQFHVWVAEEVPRYIAANLRLHGAYVHSIPLMFRNKMMARFLVHDIPEVNIYVIRDTDSRFSERETQAVSEWLLSGTKLHVMRDHPYHAQPIMGGMWGWKKDGREFSMLSMIKHWFKKPMRPGEDQDFLRSHIWTLPVTRIVHDSCGKFDGTRNWPQDGPSFVGEYISEKEQPNEPHRQMRLDWLKSL